MNDSMNDRRLLQRFVRYVKIETTAKMDANTYPSSPGQLRLGKLLVRELLAMGVVDAVQNEHGIVFGTIPANIEHAVPTVAFCSHMDTEPSTPGKNVKPQVIRKYAGGNIPLPGNPTLEIPVADNPELEGLVGTTLITTDGTTLLGADDKAGLAIIMEAAEWILEHPEIKHGAIRLCFTCDEEVGNGVAHIKLEDVGAVVCYTVDGHGTDEIDVETFSAELADVTITGVNIHPSIAKDRMTNALRAAADFMVRLPNDRLAPEVTEGRQGFIHPLEIVGGVGEVRLRFLLRDFDTAKLLDYADLLRQAAQATMTAYPKAKIDVKTRQQYLNMADGLAAEPRAVNYAVKALTKLGRTAKQCIVRGGTDGSRLTELGLPSPNISSGAHSIHSPLEWASLTEMQQSVAWIVSICEVWATEN